MARPMLRNESHVIVARATFPACAHQDKWAHIAKLFRLGHDTFDIAASMGIDEFAVANVLREALMKHRERADG